MIEQLRPITIDDIRGQDLVKQCLLAIVKNPLECPKMIILSGLPGTGRKTLAKNFVKSIYCQTKEKSYSNCGVCEICKNILDNKAIYKEIDYSQIDQLEYAEFIIVKSFERCPRQTQAKLYDWFNSLDKKPVIILITENTDNIINDITSLSFILRTSWLTESELKDEILSKKEKLNLDISNETIDIITRRSKGSLETAYKILEKYFILDKETFSKSLYSAREYYICFLISCYRDRREDIDKYITSLKQIPLAYLKIDYEALIVEIMKTATKYQKPKDKLIELLIKEIKTKALDLYYILNDKIIYNSFDTEDKFQAAMYVIYLKLTSRIR